MFAVTELDLFQLHTRARKDSQRTRYTLHCPLDPRRVLARQIESRRVLAASA
jgi:hypothetical protein